MKTGLRTRWDIKCVSPSRWQGGLLLVLFLVISFVGNPCTDAAVEANRGGTKSKPVETIISIYSVPPGALVMVGPADDFQEQAAFSLGKTPLFRNIPLPETGYSIQITKAGFQPWNGRLTSASPKVAAELVLLTDEQRKQMGWLVSPRCTEMTVVPCRLGIKKVGKTQDNSFDSTPEAADFTNRFLQTFSDTINSRFTPKAELRAVSALANDEFWIQLQKQMEGVRVEKIGFYPIPIRLDFATEINTTLGSQKGAVLLVRAEAYYLGKGSVFARVAVPIIMSAGSAYGGSSAASAAGSSFYTYSVFGPPPSSDVILVQLFLIHSQTRELLWFGQAQMPQFFRHQRVTETIARRAADMVPSVFVADK